MGEDNNYAPLFETKLAKGRLLYKLFAATIFLSICLVWTYRVTHIPKNGEDGRWVWIGMLAAEIWFGFYWIITQSHRWKLVYRDTFRDRLFKRYGNDLPGVDIFVCTADPEIEPPLLVVNTVLSVMAYDYPPENLSVYLSDDGGSNLTFYAMLEAAEFARYWIPYCKKFKVESRSPTAHFVSMPDVSANEDFAAIKKLYTEMKDRIETATKLGRIPEEAISKHKGFSQWDSYFSKRDHDAILQILIDGRDSSSVDIDGCGLPTLVYLAREKRPQHFHNFKAGAINALIRVSSKVSNGPIILTLDCDMYSNNAASIRDALCFFMDEQQSHDIAFVQFPQCFDNLTKNDLYSSKLQVIANVEFHGLDGHGGPMYIGTNCFHRRDILCGRKFSKNNKFDWKGSARRQMNVQELEEEAKPLAGCTYEQNTQWGNEMGLKYGCPVEDVITGLSIQCNGWKSVYSKPEKEAFFGVAPTSLPQVLVQHKRWSEGDFQILYSKYSLFRYAHGKITLGLQLSYSCYCLWAPNCFAMLYYSIVPPLCLLKGVSLFPQMVGFREVVFLLLLALLSTPQAVLGIRFVIDREECFSHDVKYEGDTVHVSFVVVKVDSSWHYSEDGVDLVIKGPSGDQIHDFRDKISDKYEFMANHKGVHRFCFTNKSPYHETIDFDVQVGHFSYYDEHAKDEHVKPLLEQIGKLEEALYNIQFEQHFLESQTDRQAIINEAMSTRAIHKAVLESASLVSASFLQVFLLKRLFERKLGITRV